MSSETIKIEGFAFSYPGAVRETLSIPEISVCAGERVALIGRSGAGKSTLLRMLDGRVRGWQGSVEVLGVPLAPLSPPPRSLRCDVGFIFQEFALVEQATVFQNILNGRLGRTDVLSSLLGRFTQHDRHASWHAMHDVSIDDHAEQRVDQLSGGQRQRVAIARCLAQQPKLILADEPVSNLDPATARSVLELLSSCARQRGVTLLVSSHQPELARDFVERIIALDGGRIVYDGPSAELDDERLKQIYGDATNGSKLELVA